MNLFLSFKRLKMIYYLNNEKMFSHLIKEKFYLRKKIIECLQHIAQDNLDVDSTVVCKK